MMSRSTYQSRVLTLVGQVVCLWILKFGKKYTSVYRHVGLQFFLSQ